MGLVELVPRLREDLEPAGLDELGVGFNPDLTARDNVIINAVHQRRPPMMPASAGLQL